MNLPQLRALVAVADTGSITAAAARLGLTQSGASQAVAALEEQLGVRLITRGRRGAVPTAVGERVVEHAREVLAGLDAVRRAADAARGLERGRLRLAAFPTIFATLLPPLLRRFRTLHPGVEVVALEAGDDEMAAWLVAGTVDVGVAMDPAPGEAAAPLGRDEWVAVVPAGHPLARASGGRVAFARLAAEPFVLATGGCATHARSLARGTGLELTDVRVEVRDWASAFALVREGVGVALVPEPTLPEDRRGLRVLRLAQPLYRRFGLQVSGRARGSPAVRALLEVAAAGHPYTEAAGEARTAPIAAVHRAASGQLRTPASTAKR